MEAGSWLHFTSGKDTLFSIGMKLLETLRQVDYLENKTVNGVLLDAIHRPYQGIMYFYNPIRFPCTCVA
jgi:hypothetical protein